MSLNSIKDAAVEDLKALAKQHHKRMERKAGYALSENQVIFCLEAEAEDYEIYFGYSGRFMFGELCPCVTTDRPEELFSFSNYQREALGLTVVAYARY